MNKIGVLGGSGVYNLENVKLIQEHDIETPFGRPSDLILELEMDGVTFFFIARHGRNHTILPHEVNYRANIFALKSLGVRYLVSISAVGSLIEECPPLTFVLPDQFIDWTKGQRERTFFGKGLVAHVSTAHPIDLQLQDLMAQSCDELDLNFKKGGSYICIEGPQFSSKAESQIYRSFGASVIGMTNVPESYLAKEAGLAYATIAMVTDYDNWKEEHCNVEEIMKTMKENNINVQRVLKKLLPKIKEVSFHVETENQMAIMTPKASMTEEQKEIVEVLIR